MKGVESRIESKRHEIMAVLDVKMEEDDEEDEEDSEEISEEKENHSCIRNAGKTSQVDGKNCTAFWIGEVTCVSERRLTQRPFGDGGQTRT